MSSAIRRLRVGIDLRAFRSAWIVGALASLVLSAGCFGGDDPDRYGKPPTGGNQTPPSASPSVSVSPTIGLSDDEAIKAQYRRFWTETLPKAYAATGAGNRRKILEPAAVDPALTRLLENMASQDADSKRAYGADIPLRESVERMNDLSLVRGCLDSSQSGLIDGASGRKISRGPARNPVLVNLRRGRDNIWRVSFVKFPGGNKC
jgi:hypothetical protein